MRVIDLYSGVGGWSEAFLQRGHEVLRIDNDVRFTDVPNTFIQDVTEYGPIDPNYWDVVLASPPCQGFSVASLGKMWDKGPPLRPKHPTALAGVILLRKTLRLIADLNPTYWWLENPRGMMRRMPELEENPAISHVQVSYCQYGESRQKMTDLWGVWPTTWTCRPWCRAEPRLHGYSSDGLMVVGPDGQVCHEAASRGSRTGTQGIKDVALRSAIPFELSEEVCLACESAL